MADIKPRKYYVIIIDGIAPIHGEYRVLAENEEDAIKEFERGKFKPERPIQVIPQQIKRKKLSVKDQITGMISRIINY